MKADESEKQEPRVEDLKAQILAEIEKSGFPLEVAVARELYEAGWFVTPNVHHADDQNNVHEVDAVALFGLPPTAADPRLGNVGMILVVECKKSRKKPWVFFQQPWSAFPALTPLLDRHILSELRTSDGSSLVFHTSPEALLQHHFHSDSLPITRTYFEAFKQDHGAGDIYTAVKSAWRAHSFVARWFRSTGGMGQPPRSVLVHDLIILEGHLFSAVLDAEGEWSISEQDHVILRTTDFVTSRSEQLFSRNEVVVDVIRHDYLSRYLEKCHGDVGALESHLRRVDEEGWLLTRAGSLLSERPVGRT